MAHIFKKPSKGQNGIIVLSHQETGRIENNPDLYPFVFKLFLWKNIQWLINY